MPPSVSACGKAKSTTSPRASEAVHGRAVCAAVPVRGGDWSNMRFPFLLIGPVHPALAMRGRGKGRSEPLQRLFGAHRAAGRGRADDARCRPGQRVCRGMRRAFPSLRRKTPKGAGRAASSPARGVSRRGGAPRWSRPERPPGGSKGEWRTTTLCRRGERELGGGLGEACGTVLPREPGLQRGAEPPLPPSAQEGPLQKRPRRAGFRGSAPDERQAERSPKGESAGCLVSNTATPSIARR